MTDISNVRYGQIDHDYATHLARTAPSDDGPVWMINLMKYRPVADYADGRESTISGRDADDLYAPFGPLAAVGAQIVLVADVDAQLLGATPRWDRVAIVKYPTRRAFVEMQALPEFVALHAHKDAGMEQTIIVAGLPFAVPEVLPASPDWSDVRHPSTADDGDVLVLHLLRFHEDKVATSMVSYQDAAAKVAVPYGLRLSGWFAVEGTIVGDGRTWDQARFNAFPSKAAFMAVVLDPDRLAAQRDHREVAIADTYTLILRPVVNTLATSVAASPAAAIQQPTGASR